MPTPDWPEILRREGPAAWRAAYRLSGNRADADECFQEACLAALEVSRREAVRAWGPLLRRLAAARAVDRLRLRARRGELGPDPGADWDGLGGPGPDPAQSAEQSELAGRLRRALAGLPAGQAGAFALVALEGASYREAARQLGVSVVSVGVLLHRARARLREQLEAFAPAPGPGAREEPR